MLVSNADPAGLAAALGLEPIPTTPPRLHGTLEGIAVDITIVNGDDEVAQRMRAGPRDAALLAAQLRDHGRDDAFQAAWPHVRQFVRTRALGHNGLGWFGSFGWALLLAIPLVADRDLQTTLPGATLPAWLRWLSRLSLGARVSFETIRLTGDPDPFFLAAPAPPPRDVARLSKRAASTLFAEARAASLAVGDATTDAALARIADIATDPPAGTTLVITGDAEHSRGRYDGTARGLLRELEALGGAVRSWGRFDTTPDGDWEHRITVPPQRQAAARTIVEAWLALTNLDATLS